MWLLSPWCGPLGPDWEGFALFFCLFVCFFVEEMYELAGILSSLDASSSIQLVYVGALLGLLSGAVFLVVRQVLFRTQLEEATKELSEKARTGDATYDEYYELGVLLIRKKLFATALKHLDSAKRAWEGDEEGLSQVSHYYLFHKGESLSI